MYENDPHNDFESVTSPGGGAVASASGESGFPVAGLGAVAMLTGIAIAVHMWMPPAWERATLIMAIAGVSVWVLAAFTLHLGAERAPLLGMLVPTVFFLSLMFAVFAFAPYDLPEGAERLANPTPSVAHEEP